MSTVVHTVERLNWRAVRYKNDSWETLWQGFIQLPGGRRLRSFDTPEEADAFQTEQEKIMRARVNPFTCGGPALHYQTSLDADRLHDWLLDAGIEPPGNNEGERDWRIWWDQAAPLWNDAQRVAAWHALDRVRFHRVVERPKRRTAYIVTRREWEYNDQWFDPDSVAGKPIEAYSTFEKAEAARSRMERKESRNWDVGELEVTPLRWAALEPGEELLTQHTELFGNEDDHLFYEVFEVEIGE